jgi:hypothetical protein
MSQPPAGPAYAIETKGKHIERNLGQRYRNGNDR